jgi:hypothetical protein
MPAEPIDPDQLDGERFRVDLLAYPELANRRLPSRTAARDEPP